MQATPNAPHPRDVNVMVTHAHAIGNTAVARSLGRAGYRVHALTDVADAVILRSRFVAVPVVTPSYSSPDFGDWILDYVGRHDIRVIIPSEGFLVATREQFGRLQPLMPLPRDWAVVERSFSKTEYFDAFLRSGDPRLREHIPPSHVVWRGEALPSNAQLEALGTPLYVKADEVLCDHGRSGGVFRCANADAARTRLQGLLETHRGVLVQGPAAGVKATCNLCLHQGRVLAESMAVALHEAPHDGGLTVLRRTWWHEAMRDDALRRLEALHWEGVAMMEYKWDAATREFTFIEANTRFWAALHLDLFAGADFPRVQVDAFLGRPAAEIVRPTRDVTCRYTVPGDTSWLLSSLRDPTVPTGRKLRRLAEFIGLFLDPRIESDLFFPGDRALYWREWLRFLRDLGRS
jgi:hypothetical protein